MPADTTLRPNRAEYTPELQADINLLWARLSNLLGPHQTTILFKGRGKAEFIAAAVLNALIALRLAAVVLGLLVVMLLGHAVIGG